MPSDFVPLMSNQLKGYVLDGRQTRISCGKYPAGVNQYTEIKIIHSGTVHYNRPDIKNNPGGLAAIYKFQGAGQEDVLNQLAQKGQDTLWHGRRR